MTAGPADIFTTKRGPVARIFGPIPVYGVDLARLRDEGRGAIFKAPRARWRYLISNRRSLAALDLREDEDGWAVDMLDGSRIARAISRAGRKAERIAEAGVDYQARILDLELIGNSVLWLHAARVPSRDLFISLADRPAALNATALIERLRHSAARRLSSMVSAADGTGG